MHEEVEKFLRQLKQHSGVVDRRHLGPTSSKENTARRYCARMGWAVYRRGYWRLTEAGERLFAKPPSAGSAP